jgi:hypothetical protein
VESPANFIKFQFAQRSTHPPRHVADDALFCGAGSQSSASPFDSSRKRGAQPRSAFDGPSVMEHLRRESGWTAEPPNETAHTPPEQPAVTAPAPARVQGSVPLSATVSTGQVSEMRKGPTVAIELGMVSRAAALPTFRVRPPFEQR